jgi:hypothetical protein
MRVAIFPFIVTSLVLIPSSIGGNSDADKPTMVRAMDGNSLCEGILIHQDIVMTTVHCAEEFGVGTKVTIVSTDVPGQKDEFNKVIQQYRRPGYHPNEDNENDLMLLKLQWPSSSPVANDDTSMIHSVHRTLSDVSDFVEDGICDLSTDPPEYCTPAESRMLVNGPTSGPTTTPDSDSSCSRLFCCGHD